MIANYKYIVQYSTALFQYSTLCRCLPQRVIIMASTESCQTESCQTCVNCVTSREGARSIFDETAPGLAGRSNSVLLEQNLDGRNFYLFNS